MIVIDASVAVKLYRDEPGSAAADRLIAANAGAIVAPDLFAIEVASTIVRDANSDKGAATLQEEKLGSFARLLAGSAIELTRASPRSLLGSSRLAIELGHPLKDCIYLALAMELDCALVTADARFVERARPIWRNITLLGAEAG